MRIAPVNTGLWWPEFYTDTNNNSTDQIIQSVFTYGAGQGMSIVIYQMISIPQCHNPVMLLTDLVYDGF